jgi:hypothetical protein
MSVDPEIRLRTMTWRRHPAAAAVAARHSHALPEAAGLVMAQPTAPKAGYSAAQAL